MGLDGEVEQRGEFEGVEVLRVDDAGAGLEGVAGDGDGRRPSANDEVSLEYCDLEGTGIGGIGFEEMGEGGPCDSAADYAYSMRRGRRSECWRRREEEEEEEEEEGSA